jgi:hypothetical protein
MRAATVLVLSLQSMLWLACSGDRGGHSAAGQAKSPANAEAT